MDRSQDVHSIDASVAMLVRVAHSHRARRRIEDRSGVPLGPTTLSALAAVITGGPMRYGAVARKMGVQPSRASKEVRVLIETGFVTEQPDPDDRRAMLLEATDKGHDAYQRYRHAAENAMDEVLSSWPDRDVHRLAQMLGRLAEGFANVEDDR